MISSHPSRRHGDKGLYFFQIGIPLAQCDGISWTFNALSGWLYPAVPWIQRPLPGIPGSALRCSRKVQLWKEVLDQPLKL